MPEDARWAGRVEAELEALRNELIPLKPLPTHTAILLNTMERMERAAREEREAREARDKTQDDALIELKKSVDKGNGRRATLALWIPVFVALIGMAGYLLRPG